MKPRRFQTDARLWTRITLILLAVGWCIPILSIKSGPSFSIATALKELAVAIYHRDGSSTQMFGIAFVSYAIYSAFVAAVFGWVLHCVVVIVRTSRDNRRAHGS